MASFAIHFYEFLLCFINNSKTDFLSCHVQTLWIAYSVNTTPFSIMYALF